MDQWLVRTASNVIGGPFTREQVIQKIQGGDLGPQDEVCQANQFWIFLHEHQEVERQLGMRIPRPARLPRPGSDEDVTETQLENPRNEPEAAASTQDKSVLVEQAESPVENSAATLEADGLPEMPDVPEEGDGSTSVMMTSRNPVRESAARAKVIPASQNKTAATVTATPTLLRAVVTGNDAASVKSARLAPRVMLLSPQIERSSVWRGFAWALLLAACVVVYAVLKLLHTGGPV